MLKLKRYYTGFIKNKKIVAVTGLAQGVGTTHLAVMLATYLTNGRHCRVAVVEYGQHGSYEQMKNVLKYKRVRLSTKALAEHGFSAYGIDFYQSIYQSGAIGILRENYDVIIIDQSLRANQFISIEEAAELWQADMRIAVISMVPWKWKECIWKQNRLMETVEKKRLKTVSMTDAAYRKNEKVLQIPWEPDPFHIKAETIPWLYRLLEE